MQISVERVFSRISQFQEHFRSFPIQTVDFDHQKAPEAHTRIHTRARTSLRHNFNKVKIMSLLFLVRKRSKKNTLIFKGSRIIRPKGENP